jgi:hypothetical protein
MPDPACVDLRPLLGDDEHVLWEGRPVRERFRRRMWPISLVGALFAGFAILSWLAAAGAYVWGQRHGWRMEWGGPLALLLVAELPLIAVGLGLYFVPRVAADRLWPTVVYALTNRRALMRAGGSVTEVRWADVQEVAARDEPVGRVIFRVPGHVAGPYAPYMYYRHGIKRTPMPTVPMFEAVERPADVARIARDAMNRAR